MYKVAKTQVEELMSTSYSVSFGNKRDIFCFSHLPLEDKSVI